MRDQTSEASTGSRAGRGRWLAVLAAALLTLGHALLPTGPVVRLDEYLTAAAPPAGATTFPRGPRRAVDLTTAVPASAAVRPAGAEQADGQHTDWSPVATPGPPGVAGGRPTALGRRTAVQAPRSERTTLSRSCRAPPTVLG